MLNDSRRSKVFRQALKQVNDVFFSKLLLEIRALILPPGYRCHQAGAKSLVQIVNRGINDQGL